MSRPIRNVETMTEAPLFDVAIVGAGGAGGMLALELTGRGVRVALIEARPNAAVDPDAVDQRGFALAPASVALMRAAGLWESLAPHATPITGVHISKAGVFGSARFHAADAGLDALAQVVPGNRLAHSLDARLDAAANAGRMTTFRPASLEWIEPAEDRVLLTLAGPAAPNRISARLLVGADGSESTVARLAGFDRREYDYEQTALVGVIAASPAHRGIAYERFTADGPIALLPVAGDRRVAVLVKDGAGAEQVLAAGQEAFAQTVRKGFAGRLSEVRAVSSIRPWVLRRVVTETLIADRTVLIGNAAHTIHPNGAQGLNLGLKDVAELAARIVDAHLRIQDPGRRSVLEGYRDARLADHRLIVAATHLVARGSLWRGIPGHLAFHGTFGLLGHVPPLRQAFLARATGREAPVHPGLGTRLAARLAEALT